MATGIERSSRRLLCACSIVALAGAAAPVLAQDALPPTAASTDEAEEPDDQEIIVTGSNIRSREISSRVPIQVLGRVELESYGATQISDVFRAIPSNTGSEAYSEASPRAGVSQFNLRGLGYTSTLTLINGRRAGVSPLADETGAEFVDINQFPLAMIERVDVLKDGASAIYGSDAVAGVVNIVTRRGFEGFELSGGAQDATNRSWNVNLAAGKEFDGGFFNIYATYYRQTGNFRSNFDWLMRRVGGNGVPGRSQFLSGNGAPGNYFRGGLDSSGNPIGLAGGVAFADPDCEAAGGVFRISDAGVVNSSSCLNDFTDQVGIIPESNRAQIFSEFEYALSDRLTAFGEASFSRNVQKSTRGPGGFANGSVVGARAGFIYIPAAHPFNFFQADPANPSRLVYVGPDNWDPAVDTAVDVISFSRIFGSPFYGENAGVRRSQTDYWRGLGGLDYEISDSWHATAYYQFASADFQESEDFRFNAAAINAALLDGTLNPFGTAIAQPTLISPKDGVSVAANSQAVLDRVFYTSNFTARTEQHVVEGIVSGTLMDVPGGTLDLALGAQYRRVTLDQIPDSLAAAGGAETPTVDFPIHGSQRVVALYGELSSPLGNFGDVQAAVRFEDYGSAVGSSVNPKLAARIGVTEGLSLRGSVGTSFQAPTIRQTSETQSRQFLNSNYDTVNGQLVCSALIDAGNFLVKTSGGDGLQPQSSTNFNLGIVAAPAAGVNLSLDYWHYRYTDLIAPGINAQTIVTNDCADDGIPNDPRVIQAGGGVAEIRTSFVNVGRVVTDGFDLSAAWRFDVPNVAAFQLSGDVTYVNSFDVVGSDGGSFSGVGSRNFANNFRPIPRWRGTGSIATQSGPFGATVTLRHIDGYKNDQSNNAPISSWTTVDLALSYGIPIMGRDRPLVLTVGADNLFDRDPPALRRNDASGNPVTGTNTDFDRPGYEAFSGADIRGRILYFRVKQQF